MSAHPFDHPHSRLVVPLHHFTQRDLAIAGGKGANLGELHKAGFDVPPGFVITTAAYDLLLESNDLLPRFEEMLDSLDLENPQSVQNVSQQIQGFLQQCSIPVPLRGEILNAYGTLHNSAVAVRSSATAEDLPEAAFAGQQETFLNVIGEEALMEAVRACWASLWGERAILYRARQNVDQATVKLAVVVQKMVPADVAGVMFTANPVSGARDELIIDANPGLGEAVVSGMVTPDHFVLNKRSRRIKEQRLGRREVIIRPLARGGTEQLTSTAETTNAALTNLAIRRLAQIGIEIERHYAAPQDIEWAWIGDNNKTGRFFVLQTRPMTALPEPLNVRGPMRMLLPVLAEMWPQRPYPLDMTTFTGAIERAIGTFLVAMIGKGAPSLGESLREEEGVIVELMPPQVHLSPRMLVQPWITLWRTRRYEPAHWQSDPLLPALMAKAGALEEHDLRSFSWTQILELLNEALALIPRAMELRERYFPQSLLGLAGLRLLLALARQTDCFGTLVSGIQTKTTDANQALEDLATMIRTNSTLQDLFHHTDANELPSRLKTSEDGRMFLEQFESFLDRYGHRETTLTISQPAWKDQPEVVLGILKVLAETEPQQGEREAAWQQARDQLLNTSILGIQPLRTLFLRSLTNARAFFQIREDTHFYATLTQPVIRRAVLELSRRLVEAGALTEPEDVFHLRLDELQTLGEQGQPSAEALAKIHELVVRRKAKRESLANKPMIDPRLLSANSRAPAGEDVLLSGTSGSPGLASGPARIIQDVTEFGKLRSGDVLVAPVTNPAWTPLFQRAAAVVVDTGGAASHAAIVAREYGIPAVMATMSGTKQLTDGQWVQVDGTRGLVLKAEEVK